MMGSNLLSVRSSSPKHIASNHHDLCLHCPCSSFTLSVGINVWMPQNAATYSDKTPISVRETAVQTSSELFEERRGHLKTLWIAARALPGTVQILMTQWRHKRRHTSSPTISWTYLPFHQMLMGFPQCAPSSHRYAIVNTVLISRSLCQIVSTHLSGNDGDLRINI